MLGTPLSAEDCKDFMIKNPQSSFLTVTLKPKLYKYSSITQLEVTNHTLYGILYTTADDFLCVAEHTKQGNIHYHAIVNCSTKYSKILMLNKLKKAKEIGFIKFDDEINSITKTAEYMVKDVIENKKIFQSVNGSKPRFIMSKELWRILFDS